jgi:hypothetical protein
MRHLLLSSTVLKLTLIIVALVAVYSDHAFAQGGMCGDAPAMTDQKLKGELDSKATALLGYLGDMKFKGQVEFEKTDVLTRYPNADKLRLNQYFMYQVCILIMSDSRMSTEKKFELLTNARESIFNPSSERTNWLTPQSFKLTINGFVTDRKAEYNGILNFMIENRSNNDLGIGILMTGATAGGCSGSMEVSGLPAVAPAGTVAAVAGTIFMEGLKRAPDPAQRLQWFPAGGRLSGTIKWYSCSGGIPATSATLPIVLAKGRDVLELSLNSSQP